MFLLSVLSCSCFYSCLFHHTFIHLFVQDKLLFLYFILVCFIIILIHWFQIGTPPSSLPCVDVGKEAWSSKFFQAQAFSKNFKLKFFQVKFFFFSFVCFLFVVFHCVCLLVLVLHLFVFEVFIYLHMFCILIISSCFFVVCRVIFHTLCYFFHTLYFVHCIFFFYNEKRREKWVIFSLQMLEIFLIWFLMHKSFGKTYICFDFSTLLCNFFMENDVVKMKMKT
jgi:hypothetical protein